MQPNHTILGFSLEEWAAIATFVNGVTVLVLVVINILYLRSTNKQVKEARRQADVASDSLKLLKEQSNQKDAQELIRVIAILHDVRNDVNFWQPIVKDKWGMWPEKPVNFFPGDWSAVVYQAGQISAELRNDVKVLETFLSNATYQMQLFLSGQVNYRDATLMPLAWGNLENCRPFLNKIINIFESYEQSKPMSSGLLK